MPGPFIASTTKASFYAYKAGKQLLSFISEVFDKLSRPASKICGSAQTVERKMYCGGAICLLAFVIFSSAEGRLPPTAVHPDELHY